jgi:hypothetical protein
MVGMGESAFSHWESFYVIVGTSAGALIGLQFVVMALVADTRKPTSQGSIRAFGTPNVAHFGGSLLISGIMSAPWPSLAAASAVLGGLGLLGVGYALRVMYHARRQTIYAPVWEDWLWHLILPLCLYADLALAVLVLRTSVHVALFMIGAAALGLLLNSIRNAWDTVTYIVVDTVEEGPDSEQGPLP